jgi:hypothetical protein
VNASGYFEAVSKQAVHTDVSHPDPCQCENERWPTEPIPPEEKTGSDQRVSEVVGHRPDGRGIPKKFQAHWWSPRPCDPDVGQARRDI